MPTPIYDSVVQELGIDPNTRLVVETPAFSLFGYKKRKQLAGDASRVLREAGFGPRKDS